jgi:hypothetical protein
MGVEVGGPKPLDTHPGDEILAWARSQLEIAISILDNPGGGLLFATQTIGQVRAGVAERDEARWKGSIDRLGRAEESAVHREFAEARKLIADASAKLA